MRGLDLVCLVTKKKKFNNVVCLASEMRGLDCALSTSEEASHAVSIFFPV